MKRLFLIGLILGLFSCSDKKPSQENKTKKILAVLAHPDDEAAIGQILSRYAREGNKVYLVIAADGRYGVEDHAGIPPGDSLATVRQGETICACKILGIEPPVFLSAHDGFGLLNGMDEYFVQTKMVKDKLAKIITDLSPDVIISFGPDGDTGHPDHKQISDLVTEVMLMNDGWAEKYPLFYLAWPKEKIVDLQQGFHSSLNYVHEKYRNVQIKYSTEDQNKTFKSLECYKSQMTKDDIAKWIQAEKKDTSYTTYFRQLITNTKVRTEF